MNENRGMTIIRVIRLSSMVIGQNSDFVSPEIHEDLIQDVYGEDISQDIALRQERYGRYGQRKCMEIIGMMTNQKNLYNPIMIDYILHINGRGGSGKTTLVKILNEQLGLEKTRNYTTRKPRFE